ncbi:MAG: hypothetical protein WBD40_24210 [Tepidisphaeraceae bacterium]
MDEQQPQFRLTRRSIWTMVLMATLLLVLSLAQWLQIQSNGHVVAALRGVPVVGQPDLKYTGMRLSREHVLVATYELHGFANASVARWHAKPWGHVVIEP